MYICWWSYSCALQRFTNSGLCDSEFVFDVENESEFAMIKCRMGDAKRHLVKVLGNDGNQLVPIYLSGSPGCGKSDIVRQAAAELGREVIDVRLSLLEPSDLRGLPFVHDGKVKWGRPSFFPESGNSIIFLDEFSQAHKAVQGASLQLVLDRALGDFKLPAGTGIILAGNRTSDRAGCQGVISPLVNRVCFLEVEANHEDWLQWAYAHSIDPVVTGYIELRPDHLFQAPAAEGVPFATPRSWAMVSKWSNCPYEAVSGMVGEAIAPSFIAFRQVFGSFDIVKMLADPAGCVIPEAMDVRYAIASSLIQRSDISNAEEVCTLATRLPAEFTALFAKGALAKDAKFMAKAIKVIPFRQWMEKNQSMLSYIK